MFFSTSTVFCNEKNEFNILDFGADSKGSTLCTRAIQSAIDAAYDAGGGKVIIPTGKFLTGTLFLKDNVFLDLQPNGTILGSKNISDYVKKCIIYAKDAKNIGIIGSGFINGQGDSFWRGKERPYIRPERTIDFNSCQNVVIQGINIRNSAAFNIAISRCNLVTITGVTIINDRESPNTDGIDPISSSNVIISNCYIETGDDAICPKAPDEDKPCENLVVNNCVLISDDTAIKFGTRSNGVIRNCTFSNIVIRDTQYGIGFYMKDGGLYEGIQFSNISIETTIKNSQRPDRKTNCYPIFMDIEKRDENSVLGIIRNITFNNININTIDGNCLFLGMPEQKIQNITITNLRMRVINRSDLSDDHKPRGTRKLKNIAPNDYAHISSHFTFAYIDGLNIRDLIIEDETLHNRFERNFIWALETDNVVIEGFQQQQAKYNSKQSVFNFKNCKNVSIRSCKPISPNTAFLELSGNLSKDITLFGNDLTKVKRGLMLSKKVKKGDVYKFGNRER